LWESSSETEEEELVFKNGIFVDEKMLEFCTGICFFFVFDNNKNIEKARAGRGGRESNNGQ